MPISGTLCCYSDFPVAQGEAPGSTPPISPYIPKPSRQASEPPGLPCASTAWLPPHLSGGLGGGVGPGRAGFTTRMQSFVPTVPWPEVSQEQSRAASHRHCHSDTVLRPWQWQGLHAPTEPSGHPFLGLPKNLKRQELLSCEACALQVTTFPKHEMKSQTHSSTPEMAASKGTC